MCYKHQCVSYLKGACHSEKYESSFHEIAYYCSGQLRILGSTLARSESAFHLSVCLTINRTCSIFKLDGRRAFNFPVFELSALVRGRRSWLGARSLITYLPFSCVLCILSTINRMVTVQLAHIIRQFKAQNVSLHV